MGIFTNYLENACVQKSCAAEAADWILTPYRKLFNGKEVQLIIGFNEDQESSLFVSPNEAPSSLSLSGWGKLPWAITAVIISPLALIAAIFKYCKISPPKISTNLCYANRVITRPLTQQETENLRRTLLDLGLSGEVTYWDDGQANDYLIGWKSQKLLIAN